jgi:hypothetical protein
MSDLSSRPRFCPHQLDRRTEHRIVGLRVTRRWGPARIGYHLGLNPSTVHKVLTRYRCPRLTWTDPATGTRIKRVIKRRYEYPQPGGLIHVDIKKLGRIPTGGGWKKRGRTIGTGTTRPSAPGTPTCTTPSTTTPGWSTPRSTAMNARRPPAGSGDAR